MQDLTDNEDLCCSYEESKIQSFSHFLALGPQRFMLPKYNDDSERMLKAILKSFLSNLTTNQQTDNHKDNDRNQQSPDLNETKVTATQTLEEQKENYDELTLGIQEAVELRLGLLSGQRHLQIFDQLNMQDVTDDEALCRIYDEAEIRSFSDLLALGKKRLKHPSY